VLISTCCLVAQAIGEPCSTQTIVITVTDGHWKTLSGLKAANFSVVVDGKPAKIISVEGSIPPRRMIFLVDHSGSMRGDSYGGLRTDRFRFALRLAEELIEVSPRKTPVALYLFSDNMHRIVKFSDDPLSVTGKLKALPQEESTAHGRTAMLDAIYQALADLKETDREDVVYVMTDGGDNRSRYTETEVKRAIIDSRVRIYVIGLWTETPGRTAEEAAGPPLTTSLAEISGGQVYVVDINPQLRGGDVNPKMAVNLMGDLKSAYKLSFSVPDSPKKRYKLKLSLNDLPADMRHGFKLLYPHELVGCDNTKAAK